MRQRPEHRAQHDAQRPVDRHVAQQPLEQALVAEEVHEADGRQQRRREQRNERHRAQRALGRHARQREAVRVHIGDGGADDGAEGREPQAVEGRLHERRVVEVAREVVQADECTCPVEEALSDQRADRQRDDHDEQQHHQQHGSACQPAVAVERAGVGHRCGCDGFLGTAHRAFGRCHSGRVHRPPGTPLRECPPLRSSFISLRGAPDALCTGARCW
jgi:hypothetical protein